MPRIFIDTEVFDALADLAADLPTRHPRTLRGEPTATRPVHEDTARRTDENGH